MIPWPFVIVLLIGMAVHIGLGLYSRRFGAQPVQLPFEILMYVCAVWALTYALDISTDSLTLKILYMQIRFLGLSFVALLLMIIAIRFTGHGSWLTKRRLAFLLVIPAITAILALATGYTPLLRYNYFLAQTAGGFSVLGFSNGIWFTAVYNPFTYAMESVAILLLLRVAFSPEKLYARQALLFFVAIFIPVLSEILFNLGISPVKGYDITTSTFAITGLLIALAIFRYRFIDIVPVARSTLFERMADPMLVIDPEGRLADFNNAAGLVLGLSREKDIGKEAGESLKGHEELRACIERPEAACSTITIGTGTGARFYDFSSSELAPGPDSPPVKLTHLRDITDRKRAEERARHLASFPELNPMIVIETDLYGSIRYANPFCLELLKTMGETDPRIFIPEDVLDRLDGTPDAGLRVVRTREVHDRLYEAHIYLTPETSSLRIYATDITDREQTEAALHETAEYLNKLIDFASAPIIVWNPDFTISRFNHAFERLTGMTEQEVIGQQLEILFPEESRVASLALIRNAIQGERWESVKIPIIASDGTLHTVLWNSANVLTAGAELVSTIAQGVDITESEKAAAALAESERLYHSLFEHMLNGFAYCRMIYENGIPVDFTYLAVNEAFGKLTGLQDVEGKNVSETIPGIRETDPLLIERYGRVASIGVPEHFETFVEALKMWFSISVYCPERGYFVAVFDVITERKRAEETLREAQARFQEIMDQTPALIYGLDRDGRFIFSNHQLELVIGKPASTFLGQTREVFLPKSVAAEHRANDLNVIDTGQPITFEEINEQEDGLHYYLSIKFPLRDAHGKIYGICGISTDITGHKQAEEDLHETNEYLRNLLDYANAPIIVWDPEFRITRFNHAFEKLTGRSEQDVIGKHLEILFPDTSRAASLEQIKKTLAGERWETVEIPILHVSGETRIVLWNSANIADPQGTIISTIAQGQDITERKQAEEEIRSASAFLDMVIDMSPFSMWISDKEGTVTRVNRSLCQTIQLTPDDIVGKYNVLRDMNLEAQGVMPDIRAVFEKNAPARFSIPWKAADAGHVDFLAGRDMYIDVSLFPILNARGELTNVVCQWIDITERKAAEEALRETNEYLQNLLDYANAPIIVWDPSFRITRFNPAFERLTGRSGQKVIGQPLDILFPERSRDTSLDLIRKTLEGERWQVVEIPIQHQYGEVRTVLWNSANIVDPEGRIISTIAQGQDITERKQAEEALRETNEYLRNLLDYANAPIIVWDPEFRITRFNHAFERLTGRTEKDVVSRHLSLLFPEASRDASLDLIRKTLAGERWEIVEIPILHVSGETRIVLWNSANIADPQGTIISTIAQGQDITDRKMTEVQREVLIRELEQKNSELEKFTYTVSHDLKSPLITIKGFAGLIEDDALKGDPLQLKKDVGRISAAADTMQALLTDLLELSRIGRIAKPPEKTPFGTIAREAVELLAGPLAGRGVTVEIAPDLPDVYVDHARIREVVVNLIENAIKFAGDRPDPVIRIGVEQGGKTPVFFVQDNGIGINPKYLERVFNLFERLDISTHGTGIGLTIARRVIEVHGGKIWAESKGPGKGTTFKFTLPGLPAEGVDTV